MITTLDDDPTETIESINAQAIKVSKILVAVGSRKLFDELNSKVSKNVEFIFVKADFGKSLGVRLGNAINTALAKVSIQNYDYLLKLDADVILPRQFLPINLEVNADIMGKFGFCMLLKIYPFMKLLKGKWPELATEDTYIVHMYSRYGRIVTDFALSPIVRRKGGARYSWRDQFDMGISMYKLGYEPLHAFVNSIGIRTNPRTIFAAFGYTSALIKRTETYDFAAWIFKKQLERFSNLKKLSACILYLYYCYLYK